MTAGTVTPYRTAEPAGQDGFAQLLHAEWTKFRTVRGWVIAVIVAAVLIDVVGLLLVRSNIACSNGPNRPTRTGAACVPHIPLGPGGEPVNDTFYFVRQPLASHGSITAAVTSITGRYPAGGTERAQAGQSPLAGLRRGVQPWSKAGIIIKASTTQGSAYAAMMVTGGNGVRMQYNFTGDIAGLAGKASAAAPRWLRLTRAGDTVTGYDSANGTRWTKVGTVTLAGLPATVQAGLFATSPQYAFIRSSFGGESGAIGPSVATGAFDHVSLRGSAPGARWAGVEVGRGTGLPAGFTRTGGRFRVTGSGDIAPVTNGEAGSGGNATTIATHLAGVFFGLILLVIIGALFMTAEYRRGLIRVTLAASPHRGRMLAAKAVVIGLVSFVVGLVAAAVAVPVGARLSHDQGQYVFPAAWPTELRVIVGTAALLAVSAVLALAVGTMLRRSAVAVAAVVVGIVLPYILGVASVLPLGAADWLLRVAPAAAFAIQQTQPAYAQVHDIYTPTQGYFPLAPWAGFAVLCGYAAVALGLALFLLRRRDA
jgi:ABC-type transport system involved in multi-copper enzyme maturation permease subunit